MRTELQRDSMDGALRIGLWNAYIGTWQKGSGTVVKAHKGYRTFFTLLWHDFLKRPIDSIPYTVGTAEGEVRKWFFAAPWHEVYDFVEFLLDMKTRHLDDWSMGNGFTDAANWVLERELAAYRITGTQLVEITDENELAAIEEALSDQGGMPFGPARDHLARASGLVFDRKAPDYRNSIKESISAVEATAKIITGDEKATLGLALRVLQEEELHPSLAKGFHALYSWTSDAEGIRHAMLEESACDFYDAKYMLVACAAFVNYLVGKMAK